VYGQPVERNRLAELLDGPGYATSACRHALLDGARFLLWDGLTPADRMVPAYERKEALAAAEGTATLGFSEALVALRAAGDKQLRLGQVTLANPPYKFMVFLSDDPDAVVACLGVEGGQR
jgi:hypothetical protein